MTWNLNIQQQLTPTTSLQVGYVGNRGVKLYGVRDINQVDPNSPAENSYDAQGNAVNVFNSSGVLIACGNCEQAGRPLNLQFPYLEFVNFLDNGYTSIYHGLQVTLMQRAWKGLNFVAGTPGHTQLMMYHLIRAQQPRIARVLVWNALARTAPSGIA